ncbi:MAG TPA: hypothetical protein VMG12_01690, partial [Polyangiaceae bacterium]|nr:hypothetical protein [Polyangiaceae bacterium]
MVNAHAGPPLHARRASPRWMRRLALSAGLGAMLSHGAARASEPSLSDAATFPSRTAAPGTSASSAAGASSAASPSAVAPTTAPRERAREHYRLGLAHHDAGDRERALLEFEQAYALSGQAPVLFAIGQVHYELGHWALALQSLERYLEEGGARIDAARRADVARQLDELSQRTALVVLGLDGSPLELEVQGRRVDASGVRAQVVVDAGAVTVVAQRAGLPTLRRDLWVIAGGRLELPLVFPPAAPPPAAEGRPLYERIAWLGAGALALGAVGAGVATYRSHREYERLRGAPSAGPPERARERL